MEGLKKLFAARDQRLNLKAQALAPVKKPASKDLLTQLWEGFCTFTDSSASVKKDFLLFSYAQSYQRVTEQLSRSLSESKGDHGLKNFAVSISFVEYIPPNYL